MSPLGTYLLLLLSHLRTSIRAGYRAFRDPTLLDPPPPPAPAPATVTRFAAEGEADGLLGRAAFG